MVKKRLRQADTVLNSDSEELQVPELSGDKLGRRVVGLFRRAKMTRNSHRVMGKSIDEWLGRLDRAYNKIHEPDELADRDGMTTYYGLIGAKVRTTSAFIRSKYVAFKAFPFTLEATPVVELPENKHEQGLQIVRSKLLQRMMSGSGIPAEALLADNGLELRPEVAKFIENEAKNAKKELREEETKIAREAALNMTKLIQDQFAEGGFEEAMSEFVDYLALYPTAFMALDYEAVQDYQWRGNSLKAVEIVRPAFRAIHPRNIYPFTDCTNANNGSGIIELMERSKAQLASFLGNEHLGYKDDVLKLVLDKGDANWLMLETADAENKVFVDDVDTIHVLRCQMLLSGAELMEYGVSDSLKEYDFYNADIEVCNHHVIRVQLIQFPHGKRTYFSASYKSKAGSLWGISPAMMIYDRQLSVNRINYAMALNAYASSGQSYVINSRFFDRPEEIRMKPFERYFAAAEVEGSVQGGIQQYQASPTFHLLFQQLENEIRLADDECGLPSFLNGNAGLQGAGKTLGGLAMMQDNAVLGIKDCFALVDMYLIRPIVKLLRDMNLEDSDDDSIKGDAEVVATGLLGLEKDLQNARAMVGLMPQMQAFAQQGAIPPELYQDYARDTIESQGIDTSKYMPRDSINGQLGTILAGNIPSQTGMLDNRSMKEF